MRNRDGGPAFPRAAANTENEVVSHAQEGMSLRDWFAGQALASMRLAGPYALTPNREVELYRKEAAATAYRYADAMLEERAK